MIIFVGRRCMDSVAQNPDKLKTKNLGKQFLQFDREINKFLLK